VNASLQGKRERVSTLVSGAHIVTLDRDRRILADGALAIRGDRIAAVGSRRELEARFDAAEVIDGSRFVITPGFVDAHVHVTGDPLTRGYVPDDLAESFGDKLTRWGSEH
jgi:5-methylthioadenosine/S-adenosylhomocysteine deaminase